MTGCAGKTIERLVEKLGEVRFSSLVHNQTKLTICSTGASKTHENVNKTHLAGVYTLRKESLENYFHFDGLITAAKGLYLQ
jgi:hypothetical protein